MPFTVLSDADVRQVLDTLTKDDVLDMHRVLADALHSYSTVAEPDDSGCCASNQPVRMSIPLKNGATTLFMPATSDNGLGVKVVTLSEGGKSAGGNQQSLPFRTSTGGSSTPSSPVTPRSSSPSIYKRGSTPSTSSLTTNSSGNRPRSANSSTTAVNSPHPSEIVPPTHTAPHASSRDTSTSPSGTLTLFTQDGQPRAVLSASTLTAFRTALASTMLLKKRRHAHTVTVFGAGRQAYWHILLSLLLRGPEIHHIHLINRSFERAQKLYLSLAQHRSPAVQELWLAGKLRPSILTPEYGEYTRLLKECVRGADIIYCCTPSTQPLFPAAHLTSTEGRRKARYVVAVGSYKPHMQELPVEVLHQAVRGPEHKSHHGFSIHHSAAGEGGAVVVDSIEGAMKEAGEVIKSGIGGSGVVELGELVMLKRSHWAEKAEREERERGRQAQQPDAPADPAAKGGHGLGHLFGMGHRRADSGAASPRSKSIDPRDGASIASKDSSESAGSAHQRSRSGHKRSKSTSKDKDKDKEVVIDDDGGLQQWLSRGNVIYKSVGIGLMDVVVGLAVVEMAEERGIGTSFAEF